MLFLIAGKPSAGSDEPSDERQLWEEPEEEEEGVSLSIQAVASCVGGVFFLILVAMERELQAIILKQHEA